MTVADSAYSGPLSVKEKREAKQTERGGVVPYDQPPGWYVMEKKLSYSTPL